MNVNGNLEERVRQFELLQLPGQPQMMHMGTSYLVGDLWREVKKLREASPDNAQVGPGAHKIIEGIKAAIRGDIARVTIEGQTWERRAPNAQLCPRCRGVCNPLPEGSGYCDHCKGTGYAPNAQVSTWQPMETAPKDGTRILAYALRDGCKVYDVTWWRTEKDNKGFTGWGEFNMGFWPPLGWMPIPPIPPDGGPKNG